MTGNQITLVDRNGAVIGSADKIEAHRHRGQLHLAFSILVFNRDHELLLQKRAATKYHFAGLWSNTCCGHPQPGEAIEDAAERRLNEEFGFATVLTEIDSLIYQAHDDVSGLTEKEFLHVFSGHFDGTPAADPDEIDEWCWKPMAQIHHELQSKASSFTPWFRLLMQRLADT